MGEILIEGGAIPLTAWGSNSVRAGPGAAFLFLFLDWLILTTRFVRFYTRLDQGSGNGVSSSVPAACVPGLGSLIDQPAGREPATHCWNSTGTRGGGIPMATARLRVFPHPDEEQEDPSNPTVSIRLSELYPLLAQAYRDNYVWLRDFEDDELMVSNDLYEVVRAFSNCRPSA
jgi:hypothetical protein